MLPGLASRILRTAIVLKDTKMNAAMKKAAQKASAVATLALVTTGHALAQTAGDPGVEAINGLSTKATAYITAAFAVAVLVAGGFWGIKMMKKAFGAAK